MTGGRRKKRKMEILLQSK